MSDQSGGCKVRDGGGASVVVSGRLSLLARDRVRAGRSSLLVMNNCASFPIELVSLGRRSCAARTSNGSSDASKGRYELDSSPAYQCAGASLRSSLPRRPGQLAPSGAPQSLLSVTALRKRARWALSTRGICCFSPDGVHTMSTTISDCRLALGSK